jgi:hypothetical protein
MFRDRRRKIPTFCLGFILSWMVLPFAANPAAANADIAKRISEGAAITGSRLLIVGFEGLAGFSYSKAAQLESYQCKISHGMKAGKPIGLGGGHVTSALLVPIVEKHKNKVKTAMFAHTACTNGNCGLPAAIASQWMADAGKENTDGRKVIIVGHSFGGDAAAILARQLASSGVPVDSVFVVDGRRRPTGMGSVGPKQGNARWVTFFQVTDPLLMGFKVSGAENVLLPAIPGIGHILLPHNRKILNTMQEQIGNPPGEEVTLAAQNQVEACKDSTLAGMGAYRGTPGIVEGIPVAAVVGGGGYLAYQALKKKKSGGGDGGDIQVADSLMGQGKSGGSGGSGGNQGSSESVSLGGGETNSDSSTETVNSETSVVFLPQKSGESANSAGASREGSDAKGTKPEFQRSPASGERPTRFSKDSLLQATGKSSANNIGGATALVEDLSVKDGPSGESSAPGGGGNHSAVDRQDDEKKEEEEVANQDSEFQPLETEGGELVAYQSELLAGTEAQLYARGSLFERVNRKLRQRILPTR